MRFLNLTVAAVSLFAGSAASAAEWWQVSQSGSGAKEMLFFLDRESAKSRSSGTMDAWSFDIYETAQSDGSRKVKSLIRFDCTERTFTFIAINSYGNNDRYINSTTIPSYQQKAKHVIPDSIAEAQWKFVCEGPQADDDKLVVSPEVYSARYFRLP